MSTERAGHSTQVKTVDVVFQRQISSSYFVLGSASIVYYVIGPTCLRLYEYCTSCKIALSAIGVKTALFVGRNGFECIGRRSLVDRERCVRATFMHSAIENYSRPYASVTTILECRGIKYPERNRFS